MDVFWIIFFTIEVQIAVEKVKKWWWWWWWRWRWVFISHFAHHIFIFESNMGEHSNYFSIIIHNHLSRIEREKRAREKERKSQIERERAEMTCSLPNIAYVYIYGLAIFRVVSQRDETRNRLILTGDFPYWVEFVQTNKLLPFLNYFKTREQF